jgi:hypothetical protein
MVKCGVLFQVPTEFLNIIWTSVGFKGLIPFLSYYWHQIDICMIGNTYWTANNLKCNRSHNTRQARDVNHVAQFEERSSYVGYTVLTTAVPLNLCLSYVTILLIFVLWHYSPRWALSSSLLSFLITQLDTVGLLWTNDSSSQRPLPTQDNTTYKHKRQTSMSTAGYETRSQQPSGWWLTP